MTAERSSHLAGLAMLVLGAAIIGLAPILVRLSDTGPAAAGFWRLTFALPLLFLMAGRTAGGVGAPIRPALLAGVMFALDMGFWHYGVTLTSVANATVLTNLTPVVVTLIAWLAFKQRPKALFVAAVALALGGAWLMAEAKGAAPAGKSPALGDALSLVTALWYALYLMAVGAARQRRSAAQVMFWSSLVGAPLLLIAALALGEPLTPASTGGWLACLGLGLVHVGGQGSIAWALGRLPTATASVVVLVQPVVAALLGWTLFAERLTALQALGGVVALVGVVIAQWAGRAKPA